MLSEYNANSRSYRNPYQDVLDDLEMYCKADIMTTTKIYKITEKSQMNDTLNSIAAFVTALRGQRFIVGSVDERGLLSFSVNPRAHTSRAEARAECARLAAITPGKLYMFVELSGAELVPKMVNSISY